MRTETITWHDLPADGMPDAEITVLVAFTRKDDPHVDTWPGWWSGAHWMDAEGDRFERDGNASVLAWADMPAGAAAC